MEFLAEAYLPMAEVYTHHKTRPCGEFLAEVYLPQAEVYTHHKTRPRGEFLAEVYLPQAEVSGAVVVGGLVADAPPHVHHLELVPPLLAPLLQPRVHSLHQAVALMFGVCASTSSASSVL